MGGSTKAQTIGYRYSMAIHMGISRGPIDELVEVRTGDKQSWPIPGGTYIVDGPNPPVGGTSITETTTVSIGAPDLFGGDKGEGGIQGVMQVYMGKKDQIIDPRMVSLLGGDVPDFRNITTVFYDGLICSLNPYPKSWKFRVRRTLKGWDGEPWYPEKARISLRDGAIIASNAAHMIYEAATNRDWGRGWGRERLDDASFRAAADTLYAEGFGLCMRYNRQSALSDFVQEIINHVQGVVYTSHETGLLVFDLIRNNYDPDTIPLFTYEDGLLSVEEPEVATRDDTINEVIVKFKDPIRNEERSVRVHNLASIQSQRGARNSNTVEYPGIPVDALATRVATRDLKIGAVSGKRYKILLNRKAWKIFPSSVFRISAPDKGISNLILRAGKVTQKNIKDGTIEITAIPDIFGMPATAYTDVQQGYWEEPDRISKLPLFPRFREMTYRDLFNTLTRADLSQVSETECYVGGFSVKPTALSLSFTLQTKTTSEENYENRDTDAFSPAFVLRTAITAIQTVVPFTRVYDPSIISLPAAGQIGNEIVRIDAVNYGTGGGGTLTIARGCVDTLPETHPISSPVHLFDNYIGSDQREYQIGETINGRLITNTSTESLDPALAPVLNVTVVGRQGRPYSAANLHINGLSTYQGVRKAENIEISWNHRDRLTLQDRLLGWFEGDFTNETGVIYDVYIYDGAKTYRTFTNITNSQVTYTKTDQDADGLPGNDAIFYIRLVTKRGAITSLVQPIGVARRA